MCGTVADWIYFSWITQPIPWSKRMLLVSPRIQIPLEEFEFTYARSSGPGGQNVNKVNSKAMLRWPVMLSPTLPADVRARLVAKIGNQITNDGDLIITSDRCRDQPRNREDCLEKLAELLKSVATAPKKRRPTKPGRAAKERRLKSKQEQSQKKQQRQYRGGVDWRIRRW
jgi:ribosome-associated protein